MCLGAPAHPNAKAVAVACGSPRHLSRRRWLTLKLCALTYNSLTTFSLTETDRPHKKKNLNFLTAARNQGLCSDVAYESGGEELDEAAGDRHQQPRPRATGGCVLLHHVMGSVVDHAVRCLRIS